MTDSPADDRTVRPSEVDHVLLILSRKRTSGTPVHLPSPDDPDTPVCQSEQRAREAGPYDRRDPRILDMRRLCKVCDPDHEREVVGARPDDLFRKLEDPNFDFDDLPKAKPAGEPRGRS